MYKISNTYIKVFKISNTYINEQDFPNLQRYVHEWYHMENNVKILEIIAFL